MSSSIYESGLCFGVFEEECLFHVEKSQIYKSLGSGVSIVDFILCGKKQEILLIEAKSSSPKPGNQEDFDEFTNGIYNKFAHTIDLYFSLILKRLDDVRGEMPDSFRTVDYSEVKIKLLLVINGHKDEWLPPITNALRSMLKRQIKIWKLNITVMNDLQAYEYDLLKDTPNTIVKSYEQTESEE